MGEQFQGKVALVTGGGSGIGRATALAFAGEMAKVVVTDILVKGGEETVRMIKETGGKSIFVKADVSKQSEVEGFILKAIESYGRIDFAFNNAGIGQPPSLTADYGKEIWDSIISTNLNSIWLCMKYEIQQMLKQGAGAIVNSSSGAGLFGVPTMSAYSTSKHGILGLTKTAALEYARAGIRINAVCPGPIATEGNKAYVAAHPELEEKFAAMSPMKRFGTPEEIAAAVLWLCSDAASYITGIAMPIDGGQAAQGSTVE
ncbi:MAG: SDR family oxidoreductase [Proteobacteria bacterium]|nr:SDR family oxidoreductase [Pseudomonadota bacterium]